MTRPGDRPTHYQVAVQGTLGPAVLATVAELGLHQVVVASAVVLRGHEHLKIQQVAAMLAERDLDVLLVREVGPEALRADSEVSSSPRADDVP